LRNALLNSHTLITTWDNEKLVGLGNAISDGYLVVYYAYLLVHPEYQGKGIGNMIVDKFQEKYEGFHLQMLTAARKQLTFIKKLDLKKMEKLCQCGFIMETNIKLDIKPMYNNGFIVDVSSKLKNIVS